MLKGHHVFWMGTKQLTKRNADNTLGQTRGAARELNDVVFDSLRAAFFRFGDPLSHGKTICFGNRFGSRKEAAC